MSPLSPRIIGIDASKLRVAQRTGTEHYTARLIAHLPLLDRDEEVRLYLNGRDRPAEARDDLALRQIPFPRVWTHARLSWEMLRQPPDVLFVPAHVIPAIHPTTVVTIHDLGYLIEPACHPAHDLRWLKLTTRWSAHAASRIITPSRTTKHDLVARLNVDPAKIVVVPHGVDRRFSAIPQPDDDAVRHRLALPRRYVLTVGTIQPRKNLPALAKAVAALRLLDPGLHLVVVGKHGWNATTVLTGIAAARLGAYLTVLGYIDDDDLPAVYRGATTFCLPSLYEGFGLPALEALASGVPAVVSNRGSLPEIVSDAGLVADPDSVPALTESLRQTLADDDLRRSLIGAGIARAARFPWDLTATRTLDVLREVASQSGTHGPA
ncbi:MAG: glycosyltransferase family 4 protein [Thermomicrobiales bacterium]